MPAKILSINISAAKGRKKTPVASAELVEGAGIRDDAHAGTGRQISLLAIESIRKMGSAFEPGDFAENLTTEGIDLQSAKIGTRLKIGASAVVEITEHGKICHDRCDIFKKYGRCVMPEEGVFAKVTSGGLIRKGDLIER